MRVTSVQLAAGVTNVQPDGKLTLNISAGAPVTAVAEIVMAVAFVPVMPISAEEVAVASERGAALAAVETPRSERETKAVVASTRPKEMCFITNNSSRYFINRGVLGSPAFRA